MVRGRSFYCHIFPVWVLFWSIWNYFACFLIKHSTDYGKITTFASQFDKSNAGVRLRTGLQANKHAPNELPYLFVLRGFFLLTTNK